MTTPAKRLYEARRYYRKWPADQIEAKAIRVAARLLALHCEYEEKTGDALFAPTFARQLRVLVGLRD